MFDNREGSSVPQVTFKTRQDNEWQDVSSEDIFNDKTVIVFSLPGAFTPTCSSSHVPRYNQLAPTFFANGVDSIVCVSVNDTFVMNEWKKDQDADNIVKRPEEELSLKIEHVYTKRDQDVKEINARRDVLTTLTSSTQRSTNGRSHYSKRL